ncbi:hypothetical protein [Nostoc sp.]
MLYITITNLNDTISGTPGDDAIACGRMPSRMSLLLGKLTYRIYFLRYLE